MSKEPEEKDVPEQEPGLGKEETLSLDPERDFEQENRELLDRLMRLSAEYENYRKRVAREKEAWTLRALEGLVLDRLPVLDSFERAIGAAEGDADAGALLSGMKLVEKQLAGALKARDIEPIEALGEMFDPSLHEAFLSRPAQAGEAPGTIVEEIVTGYRMGDRTIRPTRGMIVVAEEEGSGAEPGPEEE